MPSWSARVRNRRWRPRAEGETRGGATADPPTKAYAPKLPVMEVLEMEGAPDRGFGQALPPDHSALKACEGGIRAALRAGSTAAASPANRRVPSAARADRGSVGLTP